MNYRVICLLCHSYKLMSAIVAARRLMDTLEGHLPDTQAGFRPARGCRDNVCALKWFIQMILGVDGQRNFFPINDPGTGRFQLLNLGGLGYGLLLRFWVVISIIVCLTLTITLITTLTII